MSTGRKVRLLTVGTGSAQAINLAGLVVLSRHYDPAAFGNFATVVALATILGMTVSLRLEMAILNVARDEIADIALHAIFGIGLALLLVLCVLIWGLLVAVGSQLSDDMFMVALVAAGRLAQNSCAFAQNRGERYPKLVAVEIARPLIMVSAAFAFSSLDANGLILGAAIASTLVFTYLVFTELRMSLIFRLIRTPRLPLAWLWRNRDFPKYSAPAVLVNSIAAQAPVFLLISLYGASAAGLYSMVNRMVRAPIGIISGAINRVYLQTVSKRRNNRLPVTGLTRQLIYKQILTFSLLSPLIAGIIYFDVIPTVLGSEWADVENIFVLLLPMMAISFVARSVAGFGVLGYNRIGLVYQVVLLSVVVLSIGLAYLADATSQVAIGFLSFGLTLVYLGQLITTYRIVRSIDRSGKIQ